MLKTGASASSFAWAIHESPLLHAPTLLKTGASARVKEEDIHQDRELHYAVDIMLLKG